MTMTAEEIAREYRLSKHPRDQISILADQNECTKREIADILIAQGCTVPKYYLPAQTSEPEAAAPAPEVMPEKPKPVTAMTLMDAFALIGSPESTEVLINGEHITMINMVCQIRVGSPESRQQINLISKE